MYADKAMFSVRLRELREHAGLSQRRLARLVHVDHSVISRIENGLRRPDVGLARALDAVLADLEAEAESTAATTPETEAGGRELELLARAIGSASAADGGDEGADAGAEADAAGGTGAGVSRAGGSAGTDAAAAASSAVPAAAEPAEFALVPPPDTVHFIGREAELAALRDLFSGQRAGAAQVCVISGMPGLGKTALAIRCANLLAERFPDGCLFLDLQGFTPGREPLSAYDALGLLLADLGVPPESVPNAEHGRAVRYRGVARDRRLLIVLDNAAAGAQVLPLLPSGGGCGVVVTSRNTLAALDDALHIALPVLDGPDGTGLFRSVAAAPHASAGAVRRIVALCGGVPLAIRIIASRCRLDQALTPEGLAEELAVQLAGEAAAFSSSASPASLSPAPPPGARDGPSRFDLGGGERSLGEAFDVSFGLLPGPQQDVFAHLGFFPAAAADAFAVAALVDAPAGSVARALEQLAAAGLLEPQGPDCYRPHDLVAAYARTVAERVLPPGRMHAALGRMLDSYLLRCHAADLVITPHRYRFPLAAADPVSSSVPDFAGYDAAHAWLTGRIDTLTGLCDLAFRHGFDEHCWQLAYTLRGVFFIGKYWTQWERTHRAAVAAARRIGDRTVQARTLNNLGLVLGEQGRGEEAHACFAEAIALCRAVGDPHGEYTARSHRAWLLHRSGRFVEALAEQRAALEFHRRADSPRNVAIVLRDMAATEAELGLTAEARGHLRTALEAFRALGLQHDAVMALNSLAELHGRLGDIGGAEQFHQAALDASRGAGSTYEQARARAGLGHSAARRRLPARSRHQLMRALRLFDTLGAQSEAAQIRVQLRAAGDDRAPEPGSGTGS